MTAFLYQTQFFNGVLHSENMIVVNFEIVNFTFINESLQRRKGCFEGKYLSISFGVSSIDALIRDFFSPDMEKTSDE